MEGRAGLFSQFLEERVGVHSSRNVRNGPPSSTRPGVMSPVATSADGPRLDPSPARSYVFRRIDTGFPLQDAGLIPQTLRCAHHKTYSSSTRGFFQTQTCSWHRFGRVRTRLSLVVRIAASLTINDNRPVGVWVLYLFRLNLILPAFSVQPGGRIGDVAPFIL